jgi:hypothetical protein
VRHFGIGKTWNRVRAPWNPGMATTGLFSDGYCLGIVANLTICLKCQAISKILESHMLQWTAFISSGLFCTVYDRSMNTLKSFAHYSGRSTNPLHTCPPIPDDYATMWDSWWAIITLRNPPTCFSIYNE